MSENGNKAIFAKGKRAVKKLAVFRDALLPNVMKLPEKVCPPANDHSVSRQQVFQHGQVKLEALFKGLDWHTFICRMTELKPRKTLGE